MRRLLLAAFVLVLGSCGGSDGGTTDGSGASSRPTTVSLTALDFDYDLTDDPIPAGPIETIMKNEGEQPHQALLYRLNEGVDFATFKKAVMKDDSRLPELASGGTDGLSDVAGPGEEISSRGDTLEPGTYAFACFIRDQRPDSTKNHAELGMIAPLVVE